MANAWYYRNESKTARERAAASSDPAAKRTWLRIAGEYDILADSIEPSERAEGAGHAPMQAQQQPLQMQQSKIQDEDKE
jgi:hypothetical protein